MGLKASISRRQLLVYGAAVIALAFVILGMAALSSPKGTDIPSADEQTQVIKAERLAREADEAVSVGDTGTAQKLAENALRLDPSNPTAQRVIDRLESPQNPSDGSPSEGDDSEADNETPSKPAAPGAGEYAKAGLGPSLLVPSSFSDWQAGDVVSEDAQVVATFEPPLTSETGRGVVRGTVYAIDIGSAAKATSYVTKISSQAYPRERSTFEMPSGATARYGTDGKSTAAAHFSRGRYAFEIIVTGQPGVPTASLRTATRALASAVPAARNR